MMMFIHRWAEELDRLTMGWVAKCQQESSHAPSHAPAPGPNVNHLELQASEIKQNIKTLQVT